MFSSCLKEFVPSCLRRQSKQFLDSAVSWRTLEEVRVSTALEKDKHITCLWDEPKGGLNRPADPVFRMRMTAQQVIKQSILWASKGWQSSSIKKKPTTANLPRINYIKSDKIPFFWQDKWLTFYGETLSMIPFDFCKVFWLIFSKESELKLA